jgi:hypothetical protein
MIFFQLSQQLMALEQLLSVISDEQYARQIEHLGKSGIGSHTRHTIELLQCAISGYETGTIDYVNRKRDMRLETDRVFALERLRQLQSSIKLADKTLKLVPEVFEGMGEEQQVATTFFREIIYNAEHAIHHLALIKVALVEMKLDVVGKDFGIAYSTIRYKETLIGKS